MILKQTNRTKQILYVSIILNLLLTVCCFVFYNDGRHVVSKEKLIVREQVIEVPDTINDWEMFTMALMKVESDYDSTAVSPVGARGYLQLPPVYIKEVNQKHNTNYTFADAWNLEKSYEIYDLMQQAHNKDYDIEKAIVLHNGKHGWYRQRVLKELKNIEIYEQVRQRVKKANSENKI